MKVDSSWTKRFVWWNPLTWMNDGSILKPGERCKLCRGELDQFLVEQGWRVCSQCGHHIPHKDLPLCRMCLKVNTSTSE